MRSSPGQDEAAMLAPAAHAAPSGAGERRGARRDRTRVLHVIQNLNYGGMERVLADVVRGVDTQCFESHILALEYLGRFANGLESVAKLHLANPQRRGAMLRPTSLARQITGIAPHVVHTHSGVWYKASLATRLAGVPRVIHTEHGRGEPDLFLCRAIDRRAARRTDVVVAVSEHLASQLESRRIVPARKIQVVPNGIDTVHYAPRRRDGKLHAELQLPRDAAVLGSIGRLEYIKGYDIMIDAFARLLATWEGSARPVLVIGGQGAEHPRIEQLIASRGLAASVRLLGWRDDIATLHAAFSIFTMSSRSEGTSISLLEAMSAGICPVVTDVGGNRAVLGENLAHRLVPPNDPVALADAWRAALCDPRLPYDAAEARTRVERHFGLTAMVSRYEALYSARS